MTICLSVGFSIALSIGLSIAESICLGMSGKMRELAERPTKRCKEELTKVADKKASGKVEKEVERWY